MSPEVPGVDLEAVLAEIDAEVRARRESGDLPPGLERELDALFERLVPEPSGGRDFETVLEKAERASLIDLNAPTESTRPVFAHVKKGIRRAIVWYMDYVVGQLTTFAGSTTRALRLLGDRVKGLEEQGAGLQERQRELAEAVFGTRRRLHPQAGRAAAEREKEWEPLVLEALRGTRGRVLHAEAGEGSLVRALAAAGLDAYGVEPHEDASTRGVEDAGLEVRPDDVIDHLRSVAPGQLGAVVLSGCIDRLPLPAQLALADLVTVTLAPGGRLVLLGATPQAWARDRSALDADLSPGRPLHPDTWRALLEERGFAGVEVHHGARPPGLSKLAAPDGAWVEALNADIDRLNEILFGPESFAVVATRGH